MQTPEPKRRLDVRRDAPSRSTGKRVASRKRRAKRRLIPSAATAGVLTLVVAGFGSVVVSNDATPETLASGYQTISSSYTGTDGGNGGATSVEVSRDFDRKLLEKQADAQAKQRSKALDQLAAKTQKRAAELKRNAKTEKRAAERKLNQWVLPVTGYQLTGRFGQTSALWSTVHTGLDFAGPSGSTIVSVGAGTVKSTGFSGAYGNRTIITLNDGTDIWYCHQSRFAVNPGEKVDPGQVIGYTGATGNVTGPHLHLEIHPSGGGPIAPGPALIAHDVTP